MAHPEHIYWAAVILVAWPASLFSRCAGVLAATWAVGQLAYIVGMPEPQTQVVLYLLACGATFNSARTLSCKVIAALYVPLATLSAVTAMDPLAIWWGIFWLAMLQVVLVPFTVDWREAGEVRRAFRDRRSTHDTLLKRVLAW